jgi:hypothetical protein
LLCEDHEVLRVASVDTVLNALQTARADTPDPLLIFLVQASDWGDSDVQVITCLMADGTLIRGAVGSDMTMAEACDEPVERMFDQRLAAGGSRRSSLKGSIKRVQASRAAASKSGSGTSTGI